MYIPLFLISSLVVIVDQLLKFIVTKVLVYSESVPIIDGFFSLTLVYNTGAAFGILRGRRGLFLILPILTIVLVLGLYVKTKERQMLWIPLGLLLGGTIGNLIDRLRCGFVIDFFDIYLGSWHWPAFNIADSCICLGVLLLFLQMLKRPHASNPN